MAYTVYVGSFNKKLNSTAQPVYTGWTSYSCVFKEETSLYRPTLTLSASLSTYSSGNYNYAVLLGRYYWITDVRAIRTGVIEIDLVIDALATWKSNITGTSAFIEYGFNTFDASDSSTRFPDKRVAISENANMYTESADVTDGLISKNVGCYIVQAVGNDPNGSHKGLATFALTQSQLATMIASVDSTLGTEIAAIMAGAYTPQEIANQLLSYSLKQDLLTESALAAVQSVKWLPFNISSAVGTLTKLYLGNYYTGIASALMLSQNTIYWRGTDIDIPWPVNDWKRNNCQLSLYLPFFGTVPVPTDQILNYSTVSVSWSAEFFSGSVSVVVRAGTAYYIYAASTNVAVEMGIGRSQVGAGQLIGGALQEMGGALQMAGGALDIGTSAVGSMFGLGSVAGALGNITGGAQNIISGYAQTVQPLITCAGSMGGNAAIGQTMIAVLTVIYFPPIGEAALEALYGHPVFIMGTPVAGFCKTRGFSVSGSIPGGYAAAINAAMDGGCFIE